MQVAIREFEPKRFCGSTDFALGRPRTYDVTSLPTLAGRCDAFKQSDIHAKPFPEGLGVDLFTLCGFGRENPMRRTSQVFSWLWDAAGADAFRSRTAH